MILFYIFIVNIISLGLPNIKPLDITSYHNDTVQVENSTFDLAPHTNFGNCSCDVSRNCDPYCCCDPDCSDSSFPYCLDSSSRSTDLRMCSDQESEGGGKVIEWFLRTSLCIQRDNNPSPGKFYDLNFNDFSPNNGGDDIENSPSSLNNIFTSINENNNDNALRPFSVVTDVRIPRRSSNGQCAFMKMLYLESVDEYCSINPGGGSGSIDINIPGLSSCEGNFSCLKQLVESNLSGYQQYDNIHIRVKWGDRSQSMSPTGYHFGETITDNGRKILLGEKCDTSNWKNFSIEFGKQTDILCEIDDTDIFDICEEGSEDNYTCFNFSNSSFIFTYTNYSISPYENGIDDNVGSIRQEIPVDAVNVDDYDKEDPHLMITQSLSIIYKSIGPKENPQHIISDFKVNYFTAKAHNNSSLRMVVRFHEQPNDLNIFDNPSMSDVYQWLPF